MSATKVINGEARKLVLDRNKMAVGILEQKPIGRYAWKKSMVVTADFKASSQRPLGYRL